MGIHQCTFSFSFSSSSSSEATRALSSLILALLIFVACTTTGVDANLSAAKGGWQVCALLDDKSLKCWGYNGNGELGLGDSEMRGKTGGTMGDNLPAVDLGTGRTGSKVCAGKAHTCALLDDGSVKCWGQNNHGQLGQGDTVDRGSGAGQMGDALPAINLGTGRTATQLGCGEKHTCVLLDDATVKCWGVSEFGQCGGGSTANVGAAAGDMGDNLLPVDLGAGTLQPQTLEVGLHSTCVIFAGGAVKCWGKNHYGMLGLGDTNDRGDGANEMGTNLPFIDLGTGRAARIIRGGQTHTCAMLDDATMKCFGRNQFGQLGYGDILTRGNNAGDMGDNLPTVNMGSGLTVKSLEVGKRSTCAVLSDDSIKCFGEDDYGQLGVASSGAIGTTQAHMGDNLVRVDLGTGRTAKRVTLGLIHTCAVLDDGSAKCWGRNANGQAGQGTNVDITGVVGNNFPAIELGTSRTVFDHSPCECDPNWVNYGFEVPYY